MGVVGVVAVAGEHFTGAHRVALLAACGIRPGGVPDVAVLDVPVVGRAMPPMPHRIALTYPAPGPGEALDGGADWSGLHLRVRWDPRDPVGAEQAALEAHRALTRAPFPLDVGDVRVVTITANSRPLPDDAPGEAETGGDGDRTTYSCTYLLMLAEFDHEG